MENFPRSWRTTTMIWILILELASLFWEVLERAEENG